MKRLRIMLLRWRIAALCDGIEVTREQARDLEEGLRSMIVERRRLISELAQLDCPAAALRRVLGR